MRALTEHRYAPVGSAAELFAARDTEVVLSGSAGTGKSRACLEKSLRARAFAHAEQTGHTVSVGHASVLVIEPVGETVSG